MILNFPGSIRVPDLVKELAPVSEALLEAAADTLTSFAMSFQYSGESTASEAGSERRLMQHPGSIPAADFPLILASARRTLESNGIEVVSEVEISFQAWRGNERAQIWGSDGCISRMFFDQATKTFSGSHTRVRRPGTTIEYRPNDKEVNLLAVMFGHDD